MPNVIHVMKEKRSMNIAENMRKYKAVLVSKIYERPSLKFIQLLLKLNPEASFATVVYL